MSLRLTWMSAKLPAALLSATAKKLATDSYEEAKGVGFRIDKVRKDHALGAFFEKVEVPTTIVDPFGRESGTTRVEYRRVNFALSTEFPQLELTSPPRGLRTFFTRLSEHFEYQTAFVPLKANPLAWLDAIVQKRGTATVTAMAVGSIPLSTTASAEMVVEGGQDVRRDVRRLLGDRKYVVKAVDAQILLNNIAFLCTLSRDGRARIDEPSEGAVRAIREALRVTTDSSAE